MKEFFKKNKISIIVFALIGLIIIPFIIHLLFKIHPKNNFFSAEWSAGDVLGFYGILLGAFSTVWGVFLSIKYAQSNYKQDLVDRSLPFVAVTTMLHSHNRLPSINNSEDGLPAISNRDQPTYYDFPIQKYYLIIKDKDVSVMAKLTSHQEEMVSKGGLYEVDAGNGIKMTQSVGLLYVPLELENIGNGAATTFSIGLYIPPYNKEKNPHCFSLARSLRVGEKIQVAIYSENIPKDNIGEYELCASYYDIFNNKYEQLFEYKIFKDEMGQFFSSLRLKGTQKRLVEKEH